MEIIITDKQWKEYIQKFQTLTIQNDFMFCHVMQDKEICSKVLNILLHDYFEIGHIKIITSQASIENHPELKAVRLDVLVEDEKGNSYDIEMQVVNRKNIEKRMRVYQTAVDMNKMQKGMDYNKITNTIVIFICPFDPIGKGLPVYFIESYVRGNTDIRFDDGIYKAIFNTSAWEKEEDGRLQELLMFFHTGKATCGVAKEIEMKVAKIKDDYRISSEFVSMCASLVDARNDGREEGRAEGRLEGITQGKAQGKFETARNCLSLNLPLETIAKITGLSIEEIERL